MTPRRKKQLVGVAEPFGCRARYHAILMPEGRPKVFSWNTKRHPDGSEWWGGVIASHGLWGVAAVADKDVKAINDMDEDLFAQAARVCVMRIKDSLFSNPTDGKVFHAVAVEEVEAEIAREQALLAAGEL